jgi:uncharacterized membrane protein
MKQKRSKYDTNPLDPDYVKTTEELWSSDNGAGQPATQEVKGATRKVGPPAEDDPRQNVYSEAPTRRYDNISTESPYPSIFIPPPAPSQPAPYRPPAAPYQPAIQRPTSRQIAGIGLPEKWAMILPYAPFYIGVIVSLLELFLVPRKEPRVRFHAAQGLALYIAITVIQTLFSVVGAIAGNSIGGSLFSAACTIFLIVSMARVSKGKPHYIAPIAELARWFNEHIEPRTKS